jgi:hypothetical protein
MKKLLLTITISLVAFATAHAQYSRYGTIENFYQANPDLDVNRYAGRPVNPGYWLVGRERWKEMEGRVLGDGYVLLGISNWKGPNNLGNGVPEKGLALTYAQAIGADIVLYAVYPANDYETEHLVGFYAKPGMQSVERATPTNGTRPSNREVSLAMDRLQDAKGLPHVTSGVWYDSRTDTYNWIGPKFGRRMSEPASQFLSEVGLYL